MLLRLAVLVSMLMCTMPALADDRGLPPPLCVPSSWNQLMQWRSWSDYANRDDRANWAQEAERHDTRDVWRYFDRLYLAVEDGRVVTLTDCPLSDSGYIFLYERYDHVGQFYVVRRRYYDDSGTYYFLVMRKTGLTFDISHLPIWSPDKARFAYADCNMMNGQQEVVVLRPSGDGLAVEARTPLPCGMAGCALSWETSSALHVKCEKAGSSFDQLRTMRLERHDDRWFVAIPPGR